MTKDHTPSTGPEEAERRDYAALIDSLADALDLRSGLGEAVDIVAYTAMSGHIADFLNLEAGLQSALAANFGHVTAGEQSRAAAPKTAEPSVGNPTALPRQQASDARGTLTLQDIRM